ncbi:MAG: malectin domain-containing carbohydrate-binding protein, partial [Cyanobacteria bacterium J06600_6]
DQSNYLKIVAIDGASETIQILLEDDDVVIAESFIQADDLLSQSSDRQIFFELEVNPQAETVIPTVRYETDEGISSVTGTAISLEGTTLLDTIRGNYQVEGLTSGLAVGLFSSNTGQPQADTFQAIFDNIAITATGSTATSTVLYRVNAGGELIPAVDGDLDWSADTEAENSEYLVEPGSNSVIAYPLVEPGTDIPVTVPNEIFDTERWSMPDAESMAWAFEVSEAGLYEVRLYAGNGFDGSSEPETRLFDVAVEGNVPTEFDDIDLSKQFGHLVGGIIAHQVEVTDGTLDLEFLHGAIENPMVNGIEILRLETVVDRPLVEIVGGARTVQENQGQVQISLLTSDLVPNGETVEATVKIEPNTAIAQTDYSYGSPTAVYDADTGIYSETITIPGGSSDATIAIDLIDDAIVENDESFLVSVTTKDLGSEATRSSEISVTIAGENPNSTILYRVNTGGEEIAATDGEIAWSADTESNNSLYLEDPGSNSVISFPKVTPGETIAENIPDEIFATERWDLPTGTEMQWEFEVESAGLYQVRLYIGNGFIGANAAGDRVFDVMVEDSVPEEFKAIDPSLQFGHEVGGIVSSNVEVTDGILNLEFIHGAVENPMVNGIEILQLNETVA